MVNSISTKVLEKDLKPTAVCDYASILNLIEQGNSNKTVAETKMNATSSRAHTIVELTFKQTYKNEKGNVMQRQSVLNLVDLAGSERSDKSMTSGDRLKEGISINLSLSCLGKCISALATASASSTSASSSSSAVRVPYRESSLTKMLMNALGGNSKTVMLATISPAESNYQETLSTLRYADRAKQIKCNAVVNEDPKDKIIRELQNEINRLKAQMKNGFLPNDLSQDLSQKDYEKQKKEAEENLHKQIEQNEKEMASMKQTYEQRLQEALAKAKEVDQSHAANISKKSMTCAHLSNINVDPMLTGALKHPLEFSASKKKLIVGCSDKCDIQIFGIGVNDRHAAITRGDENGAKEAATFYLEAFANSRVMRNGQPCGDDRKVKLENFDRLVFGASLYYLFVDPSRFGRNSGEAEAAMQAKMDAFTVERVQQEIAERSGLIGAQTGRRRDVDEIACINELIDLMPAVEEANQMSILMDRKVKYEPLILNPIVIGEIFAKPRPVVVVKKFGTSKEWIWDSEKFIDRKACMSELYLDFKYDGKIDENKLKVFDPFVDVESEPVLIGTALITPKSILHKIPLEETPKIYDYQKKLVGNLQVELKPCDKQGIVIESENIGASIVQNPEKELKDLNFLLRIFNVKCVSPKYKNLYCQYRLFGEENFSRTEISEEAQHAKINYQRLVSIDKVDPNFIKYYSTYPLFIQVYGNYISSPNETKIESSTKNWFEKEKQANLVSDDHVREEYEKVQAELEKLRKKIKNLETLLDYAEKTKDRKRIRIEYVRECILSNSPDVLTKLYKLIGQSND